MSNRSQLAVCSALRIAVVQHEDACPLGLFTEWLQHAGAVVSTCRAHRDDPLPDLAATDGLIVLGGSMSATDDERARWLPGVRRLLTDAVDRRTPTLGICLGHQLLAVACGGEVARNPAGKQLGVRPIGLLPAAADDAVVGGLGLAGAAAPVSIQWNDDIVVRLPPRTTLLASTAGGVPLAMRVGDAAWGVQFHPEVDAAIVRAWAEEHGPPSALQEAALREIADRFDEVTATGRSLADAFLAAVHRGREQRTDSGPARTRTA